MLHSPSNHPLKTEISAGISTDSAPFASTDRVDIDAIESQRPRLFFSVALTLFCLLVLLPACSQKHYRRAADREAYAAIQGKSDLVPNMDSAYTIEESDQPPLESLPTTEESIEFFGPDMDAEQGAQIVSLKKALEIAVRQNRQFQNEKENLYLEALSLTFARFEYTPIFSGGVDASVNERRTQQEVAAGIDTLTTDREIAVGGGLGANWFLRTGGQISAAFTTDFFRFLAGDRTLPTSSALAGSFSQPLLRGGGYRVAIENLTQAERDLLYSIRDFVRFRKEFTVDLVSEYYRVLQNRDRVRNAWQGYQNFQASVRREQARFEIGEARKADLAQLQESQLTNEQTWINALRAYRESLDRFKISLGLPTNSHIVLEEQELRNLAIDETHLNLSQQEAVEVALNARLDYQTTEDQSIDAGRKVKIAANGLLPDIDLIIGGRIPSEPGKTYPNLDPDRYSWNAGLDIELPFNRKSERNRFRASLINFERAKRNFENATDQVRLEIQNGWRNLDQAKREFEISRIRVSLSQSRVREQELLHETGEGDAFELVRAQEALTGSLNELTGALVNHTTIRLGFWRDLGLLYINSDGTWEDLAYDR